MGNGISNGNGNGSGNGVGVVGMAAPMMVSKADGCNGGSGGASYYSDGIASAVGHLGGGPWMGAVGTDFEDVGLCNRSNGGGGGHVFLDGGHWGRS